MRIEQSHLYEEQTEIIPVPAREQTTDNENLKKTLSDNVTWLNAYIHSNIGFLTFEWEGIEYIVKRISSASERCYFITFEDWEGKERKVPYMKFRPFKMYAGVK